LHSPGHSPNDQRSADAEGHRAHGEAGRVLPRKERLPDDRVGRVLGNPRSPPDGAPGKSKPHPADTPKRRVQWRYGRRVQRGAEEVPGKGAPADKSVERQTAPQRRPPGSDEHPDHETEERKRRADEDGPARAESPTGPRDRRRPRVAPANEHVGP